MFDEHLGYKGDDLIPREESELQDRLIRSGWECWWLPGAGVQHHVAADRLTIKGMTKSAYNSGRGAAFHRLKVAGTWHQRFLTRVGRLVASLFQIAVSSIQAFFLLVLGKPEPAIGALCRVARAAGWAVQMVKK
jgi:hypothetical protein